MSIMSMKDMAKLLQDVPPSNPAMIEKCYTDYIKKSYIIYDGKRNKAVCTRCGSEWDIAPGEYSRMHGLQERCPCCEDTGILLSAGRGRQCYTEYFRVLSFAEHNGAMWAFLNEVIADFAPFGRPEMYNRLTNIYIISKEEQTRWSLREGWYSSSNGIEGHYEKIKTMRVPAPPHAMGGYWGFYSKYNDYVYADGIVDMLARSDCKHLIEMPGILNNEGHDIIPFLSVCMKYHSVELLGKAGFETIAQAKIDGAGCRGINWRGKSLEKILKLPRRYVKILQQYDPTMAELEAFQKLSDHERDVIPMPVLRDSLNWRDYDYKSRAYKSTYKKIVEKYMPFDKWLRWAATQDHYMDIKHQNPYLLRDYIDYMETAQKLGMDIHKKSILRPKDLKQAHDELVAKLKIERNSKIDKAIAENVRADDFRFEGLMIIPATCQEDLNKESAKLGHCVKTYGHKLATGTCLIFFVRDIKNPSEPYYTLETKPTGEFVQCRGFHNCCMTDEVELFTKAFVKKLKADIKKEREELCQTA